MACGKIEKAYFINKPYLNFVHFIIILFRLFDEMNGRRAEKWLFGRCPPI